MSRNMKVVIAEPMMLLPPHPSKCQVCATDHPASQPHNAQSLFYQTKFNMEHKRGATWLDAMEHCTDDVKAFWKHHLVSLGVDVDAGDVNPKRKEK